MSLIAKSGQSIAPIPEGVYTAICYGVFDLGHQYSEKYHKSAPKVVLSWELPELRIDVERDGEKVNPPRAISKRYTNSMNEKAILRKDLEAWRGKAFSAAELKGFNLRKLLGAACQLQIIHKEVDGKTYANVGTLMALPKGQKAPKPENQLQCFSFDEIEGNPVIPANIPEWVSNLIKQSSEWQQLSKPNGTTAQEQLPQPAMAAGADSEDDLPF